MEGGSLRCGSPSKKFRKPRPKDVQTAQMNPFNTLGYRPQMSSPNQPNFYCNPMNPAQYLQYSPGTQQQFNRWEQSYQQDQQSYQQAFQQQSPFQDYREHNQDDSDSSEHNKSVQVESEEEEPVRQTGKKAIGKKAPAKRWSDEEEVALARSWLTIYENLDVGNAQKRDGFYRKIFFNIVTDHFHHLMKDKSMTVDSIYSKWNDLNSSMKKWNGFYQQASMNRKSGEGDEYILKKAMRNYKSVVKSKGFAHIQAWEMVRDNSLWCNIPLVGCQSQSTTKWPKPNESMGSANTHININLDDDEDVDGQHDCDGPHIYYELDRPTRKGKRSVASSSSHEELIQQMTEFNSFKKEKFQQRIRLRDEKLRVLQEEKDVRIQLMRRQ
ncbi:hypothetical protein R6Q57_002637 [Mikania cordata]